MGNKRIDGAQAYVQAMRTGEGESARLAGRYLAKDVVLAGATVWGRPGATVDGYDEVLRRITGVWPNTPVYAKGFWTFPEEKDGKVEVHATFPGMGAAPAALNLAFSYNDKDEINRVEQEIVPQPRPEQTDTIPATAAGLINGALANNTPMTVAYVDENGVPNLSLRGSVQVYSPTQISIWLRNKGGGMPKALEKNNNIGLLYRDSNNRSTLVVKGKGRIAQDQETIDRVWNSIQEVEQNHESRESGCALIIDVVSLQGGTPKGGVRMVREG
jgi:general stress protein 26